MTFRVIPTVLGPMALVVDASERLCRVAFGVEQDGVQDDRVAEEAAVQVGEYFAGVRTRFDLDYVAAGTPFQREVWAALCDIEYGRTETYGELAARIGRPKAARAVGAAAGRNPIAIVVPCHRLVGAGGALTGFAYGVDLKHRLLELERRKMPPFHRRGLH